MIEYVRRILAGQFEASLCMLNQCVRACPPDHWEGKIANQTFRVLAYHTLFFTDLYLSPNEQVFTLRDLHLRGGDERLDTGPSPGLPRDETLGYVAICRQKAVETLASETREVLEGVSGFSWIPTSRGELHVYNIRHIQHHAGQLSAFLRRLGDASPDASALRWVRTGWRS
jgi:hypothetical protein